MQKNETLEDIKQKSGRGVKWVGGIEALIRIIQFASTVVLARLLLPEDFGLISIVFIFTQFSYVVFDFGFGSALIQKKDIRDIHFYSVFWAYLVLAVFFALAVIVLAGEIAIYFNQAPVADILRVLSIIFFLYAFNTIPHVRLMRELNFKAITLSQLMAVSIYALTAIAMALNGYGVWSFVFGSLGEQIILTLLFYRFSRWKPKLYFDNAKLKELFAFGKNVLATRFLAYLNLNAPQFSVGKILGSAQLGYYSIAFQLVEIPVQRISKNVLRVMFPAFSKIQDQSEDYVHLYRQTVYYLAVLVFPLFAGLYLIAPSFVHFFYGSKWQPAVVPLQILTIVGLSRSLWMMNSLVFLSKGKPHIETFLNLGYALLLIPFLFLITPLGLEKVALLMAVMTFGLFMGGQFWAARIIAIKYNTLLGLYRIPILGVLGFLSVIKISEVYFIFDFPPLIKILLYILIAVPLYFIILFIQDRQIIEKIKLFLKM